MIERLRYLTVLHVALGAFSGVGESKPLFCALFHSSRVHR